MGASSLAGRSAGRTMLLLWAVGPIFELPVVALALGSFPEVAAEAVFGSLGGQLVALVALLVVLLAVGVGWVSGRAGALRPVVALLCWIMAGLLGVLMLGFLGGDGAQVFGVLLAHAGLATGVLGWLLIRRT